MDNMSLSDIAAVTKDKDNWADGGIWILILLFALGGGLWNRGGAQQDAVSEAALCSAMNFTSRTSLGAFPTRTTIRPPSLAMVSPISDMPSSAKPTVLRRPSCKATSTSPARFPTAAARLRWASLRTSMQWRRASAA